MNKVDTVEVTAVIDVIDIIRKKDYVNSNFRNKYNYHVYVSYEYEGQRYENVKLNYYSSSMREGDSIKIKIDPKQPDKICTNLNMFITLFVISFAIIFGLIGIIPMIVLKRKHNKKEYLLKNGKVMMAQIESIVVNSNVVVNGNYPYNVYCVYRDDFEGKEYRYKSGNIWLDNSMNLAEGDYVRVYVDPKDSRNYYVDVTQGV